jgi:hypothetical protein
MILITTLNFHVQLKCDLGVQLTAYVVQNYLATLDKISILKKVILSLKLFKSYLRPI